MISILRRPACIVERPGPTVGDISIKLPCVMRIGKSVILEILSRVDRRGQRKDDLINLRSMQRLQYDLLVVFVKALFLVLVERGKHRPAVHVMSIDDDIIAGIRIADLRYVQRPGRGFLSVEVAVQIVVLALWTVHHWIVDGRAVNPDPGDAIAVLLMKRLEPGSSFRIGLRCGCSVFCCFIFIIMSIIRAVLCQFVRIPIRRERFFLAAVHSNGCIIRSAIRIEGTT